MPSLREALTRNCLDAAQMQAGIATTPGDVPRVPARSHPAMRWQLDGLAVGHRHSATF